MPRIAILSDIHSNLHALRAVMDEVDSCQVDSLAFGGDIVGYGAHPRECVEAVRATGAPCVMGNHDHYVAQMENQLSMLENDEELQNNPVWMGVAHSIRQTRGEALRWLDQLPMIARLPGALLAHAALHSMDSWPYLADPGEATQTLGLLDEPVGFFGHTHQTRLFFDKARAGRPKWIGRTHIEIPEDGRCALTVGSVGQPRDGDTRAAWVIWDSDARVVELKKTDYPNQEAAAAILRAGLPSHSARRLLERGAPLPQI